MGATCRLYCGGILVVLAIAIAIVINVTIPKILHDRIISRLSDRYLPKNGTSNFRTWLNNDEPDDPVEYMVFNLYNLTNAHDMLYNGSFPHVQEVGPFIYQIHQRKIALNWSRPHEVGFKTWTFYTPKDNATFINHDGSVTHLKSLDASKMSITMVNPVIFGALWQLIYDPLFSVRDKSGVWPCDPRKNSTNFLVCVSDILFGFCLFVHSPFCKSLKEVVSGPDGLFPTKTAEAWMGLFPDKTPPSSILQLVNLLRGESKPSEAQWGWFFQSSQRNVSEALANVRYNYHHWRPGHINKAQSLTEWEGNRVLHSISQFNKNQGKVSILNYGKKFAGWEKEIDIEHAGFLSQRYTHPFPDKNAGYNFWMAAGARHVHLTCNDCESKIKDVDVYRLTVPRSNFEASGGAANYYTNVDGLANETQYHQYGPIFISTPHFNDWDELRTKFPVKGLLPPDPKRDQTFISIGKISGLVVSAAERLQINVMLPFYEKLGNTIPPYDWRSLGLNYTLAPGALVPALWFEKRSQLTDHDASELQRLQRDTHNVRTAVFWFHVGGSILCGIGVILGVVMMHRAAQQRSDDRTLVPEVHHETTSYGATSGTTTTTGYQPLVHPS